MSKEKWKKTVDVVKKAAVVENTPVGGSPTVEGVMSVDKMNRMDTAKLEQASKPVAAEPVKNADSARFKGYGVKIVKIGEKRLIIDFSLMNGEWVTSDIRLAEDLEKMGFERVK